MKAFTDKELGKRTEQELIEYLNDVAQYCIQNEFDMALDQVGANNYHRNIISNSTRMEEIVKEMVRRNLPIVDKYRRKDNE